jgi:hypothetical protein
VYFFRDLPAWVGCTFRYSPNKITYTISVTLTRTFVLEVAEVDEAVHSGLHIKYVEARAELEGVQDPAVRTMHPCTLAIGNSMRGPTGLRSTSPCLGMSGNYFNFGEEVFLC